MAWKMASLAALVACTVVLSNLRPATAESLTVELKLVSRGDLQAIDIEIPDVRVSRPERRVLTDLMVQVTAPGGALRALALADGAKPGKSRSILSARLFVVSAGRIYADALAACGAWQRDLSRCTVDCDGGQFAIRRGAGGGYDLIIGTLPDDVSDEIATGVMLAPCGLETFSGARLVPQPGRTFAELPMGTDTGSE
jgi:hypothetical protein